MSTNSYTRTLHEVHTSQDGEKWFRHSSTNDTPAGLKEAKQIMARECRCQPFVRVCHVTKKVKILKQERIETIATRQQLESLLAAGKAAVADIPGVMCNEGFVMGFGSDGVSHSPTRVTVSFSPNAAFGKIPNRIKGDAANEQARKEWNEKALNAMTHALNQCAEKLKEAGIKFTQYSQEIVLRS